MTDPLSIAGSVAGVTSLGIQVTLSLVEFYKTYKSRNTELADIVERLESLLEIFQHLEKALAHRIFQAGEQSLVKSIETSIKKCEEQIQELQDECQKFDGISSTGIKAVIKVAGRRATYPFRQSTLQKVDEDISEIRANLSFALDVLQFKENRRCQDDVTEILNLVKTNQIASNLRDWLSAPDATVDYNVTCA